MEDNVLMTAKASYFKFHFPLLRLPPTPPLASTSQGVHKILITLAIHALQLMKRVVVEDGFEISGLGRPQIPEASIRIELQAGSVCQDATMTLPTS